MSFQGNESDKINTTVGISYPELRVIVEIWEHFNETIVTKDGGCGCSSVEQVLYIIAMTFEK